MSSNNNTLVGWQPESGGRGTWSLIWSCLSTASIALWVVHHGPAPWDAGSNLPWPLSKLTFELTLHIIWTTYAIFLPEVYMYISAWQFIEAKELRDEIRNSYPPFTLCEAFFICMGGYRVSIPQKYKKSHKGPRETRALTTRQVLWLIGEDVLDWPQKETSKSKEKPPLAPVHAIPSSVLVPSQIYPQPKDNSNSTIDRNIRLTIEPQPDLKTTTEITISPAINGTMVITPRKQVFLLDRKAVKQKSRSNGFAKFVVIFQVSWFIVNCIVRGANQLPLSFPEVLTLSYIMCTFVTYAFLWHKPQDVGECATFELQLSDIEWEELIERGGGASWGNGVFGTEYMTQNYAHGASSPGVYWLIFLSSWLSGGIHFIAWNYEFPSKAEQILWRISTIVLMCIAPLVVGDSRAILFYRDGHLTPSWWRERVSNISAGVAAIAKFVILILVILSLRSAPEAIYDTYEITNYLLLSL